MLPLRDNIPSQRRPGICYVLIAANLLAFIAELKAPTPEALEQIIFTWGVVPARINLAMPSEWFTLLSSMFLHGGWMHLIGNMWFLWIFGDNVEDRLGHARFLIFYLVAGIAAALTQVWFSAQSQLPLVGASGAIAGVLGAYFVYYPTARVLTLIPLGFFSEMIEVPAFFFLGIWFLMQAFSGTLALSVAVETQREVGGVAWWAHAGGFLGGIIIALISRRRRLRRTVADYYDQ